jgi:hypothetical protein
MKEQASREIEDHFLPPIDKLYHHKRIKEREMQFSKRGKKFQPREV